jgi:hypothetical protein
VARKNFPTLALEQTPRFATLQRVTIASPDCMPDVRDKLEREGFVFAPASLMRTCLAQTGRLDDWATFADSWNDLADTTRRPRTPPEAAPRGVQRVEFGPGTGTRYPRRTSAALSESQIQSIAG